MIKNLINGAIERLGKIAGKVKYRFKENYITAHADIGWWAGHINKLVLDDYQGIIEGAVADFGCNHGACTILAARNPRVREIVGFDLNRKAICTAQQLLDQSEEEEAVKRKVRFTVSELTDIKWPSDYFDSAMMFHVLEHIFPRDREKIFIELARVMKKDAALVLTLPYEHAYDDGHQHVAFFNIETLTRTLRDHGLEVCECYRDRRCDAHTPKGHDCLTVLCRITK